MCNIQHLSMRCSCNHELDMRKNERKGRENNIKRGWGASPGHNSSKES